MAGPFIIFGRAFCVFIGGKVEMTFFSPDNPGNHGVVKKIIRLISGFQYL